MTWFLAGLILGGAIAVAAARSEAAEGPAPAPVSEAIRFRRVYVPADRLKDWPRGTARYLPMERGEFESLVQQAGPSPAVAPQALTGARYTARLLGDSLVDGEAVLDVAPLPAAPSTVWLAPCNLAVSEATWLDEPRRPAMLAVAEDGKLGVRGARPGQLQLKWSLRGGASVTHGGWAPSPRADGPGEPSYDSVEFLLDLPACPANHLLLVLPKHLAPQVERAVVVGEGSAGQGVERWRIELGGRDRCRLRLVPREDLRPERKPTIFRGSFSYEFSLRGLELSSQWTLDAPCVPARRLVVDLDPSLQLVAARYGGEPVPWSVLGAADPRTSARVVLDLPDTPQGERRVLRLGAVAPPVLGRRWHLPAMRPQGVFWQEATATLIVPSPLALEELRVSGGRQTQTGPLPAPQSGEMAEFQLFSPNAALDVVLTKPESAPEFDCGTALELSGVDMAAEVIANFRLAEGERFQIDADVSKRWTIDSVETVPANALEDWTVAREGSGPKTKARLSVRLAKALCPTRPLKLIVQARHHYSPLGRLLRRDDLAPIEFHGSAGGRRLVSIRAAGAYQLRLPSSDGLTRLDPRSLTPGELDLFDHRPEAHVFVDDAQTATAAISLEVQKPSYSAAIQVAAAATDAGLRESYVIRCVPGAAGIDRLLVEFSQHRDVPLRWSFGSEEQDQATVRPWTPSARAGGGPAARGELFEILFRRPRLTAFEFRAERDLPLDAPLSIALASLPEAARQEGTVSISVTSSRAIGIEARQVTPLPSAPTPAGRYSTERSVYRYDPSADITPTSETALVLSPQETQSATPWAWAWTCHVESRFDSGGAAHHLIAYRLQNAGRQGILLALPEGLGMDAIRGVWVDGVKVPKEAAPEGGGDWLSIPLPAERKFPLVSVLVAVTGESLPVAGALEPLLPQLDVPVLHCRWTVWLPPGYQAAVSAAPGETPWRASRTIAQRLFGPLGRPLHVPWFRPWEPDAWTQWGRGWEQTARARQYAELLFDRLGSRERPSAPMAEPVGPSESPPGGFWAERLTQAAAGLVATMLVDRLALARAGVQSGSPMPKVEGETAADRGLAMVEQAGLALLVAGDVVLLTSAADVALYRTHLAPVGVDSVWRVLPGPLAEQLALAAENGQDPTFVLLESWSRLPHPAGDPWIRLLPSVHGPTEVLAWSAYRMDASPDFGASLPIVHGEVVQGLGWSVFVGVFALLMFSRGRADFSGRLGRPGKADLQAVLLAGLAALAALLVPEAFSPLPAGALWAALAAAGARWGARREPAFVGSEDSSARQRGSAPAVAVRATLAVLTAASVYAWCAAARGEPADRSSPAPVHQVLIPVSDNQQLAGDKYYVPETLFSTLQAAASRSDERRGWVLSSASYRGILGWRTAPERLEVEELRASYDLEVFGRQVLVRIPVGRSGMDILPNGVALEGRSIQPVWPDADGKMAFEVAEPGKYRLELALKPVAQTVGDKRLVEWKIPRLATSRLELAVPPDAPDVEFPSALGAIVRDRDPSRAVVALGPADRLVVAWPEAAVRWAERHAVDVEQFLWMKLRPDSAVLDALLSFRVLEGQLREVQLAVDPRLRYFPATSERSPVARASVDPGRPHLLRLELSQPAAEKLAIPATFLLQDSSGVGNYRLPLVDVLNARTTKRWLGLSVDPSLEHSQAGGQQLPPIAVPSFVAAWGGVKSPPLAAWELSSPRPDWSVSTRPLAARVAAAQVLTMGFAAQSARVLLDVGLTVSGDAVFQHRIEAPQDLEIERISVLEEGVEQASRWARAADGAAIVFLNAATRGAQQLTLRGRLPTPEHGKLPLPTIRLEAEPAKPMEIRLFRNAAVQVEVRDAVGLVEAEAPPADDPKFPLERLVKAFRVQTSDVSGAASGKAALLIRPNRPRIEAEQITWIRGTGDAWNAEVDLRFKVAGGLADQFSLEVPPDWTGPYKTQPPATLKLTEAPGQPNRQLIVRPQNAVEGDFRLSITGPLKLAPNDRPTVPKIVPKEVPVTRHWVILPVGPQLAPMSWETHGLVPASLPEGLDVPPADLASSAAYWAVGEDSHGVLRAGKPGQGQPQIHLADFRIAWQDDGAYHALATFDLDPAGLVSCPLALPPECRLVQVLVGGQSALIEKEEVGRPFQAVKDDLQRPSCVIEENRWHVPLASTRLPQRIEVLFAGKVAAPRGAGSRDFAMPSLGEIPVRQSIWTVTAPGAYRVRCHDALDGITPVQRALAGLRNLAAILDRVAEIPGVEGESLARWYRDWAGRWLSARTTVDRQLVRVEMAGQAEAASLRAEVESLETRQHAASHRLGLSGLLEQMAADPAPREGAAAIWLTAQEARRAAIQSGTTADPTVVSVAYERLGPSATVQRMLAALAVAALGLAAAWGVRRGVLPTLLLRWPYGAGMAVGLAWWWLLTPSVLGFGLAVTCGASAAWSHWRNRTGAVPMVMRLP